MWQGKFVARLLPGIVMDSLIQGSSTVTKSNKQHGLTPTSSDTRYNEFGHTFQPKER